MRWPLSLPARRKFVAWDTQGVYTEAGGCSWPEEFGGLRYGATLPSNVFYRIYAGYFHYGAEVYPDGATLPSNVFYRIYAGYFHYGAEVYPDGASAGDGWQPGRRVSALPG